MIDQEFIDQLKSYRDDMICFDVKQMRRLLVVVLSMRDADIAEILGNRMRPEEVKALFSKIGQLEPEQPKMAQPEKPKSVASPAK